MDTPTKREQDQARAYAILGSAFATWSHIESEAGCLFQLLTAMRPELSNAVFFSARSFNGQLDMLRAALQFSELSDIHCQTTSAIIKKLSCYYQYRNRLAHSWIPYVSYFTGSSLTEPNLEIIEHFPNDKSKTMTFDGICTLERNFKSLYMLLTMQCELISGAKDGEFSLFRQLQPGNIQEELDALPNEADGTQLSQKQKGRERQRRAALRSTSKTHQR